MLSVSTTMNQEQPVSGGLIALIEKDYFVEYFDPSRVQILSPRGQKFTCKSQFDRRQDLMTSDVSDATGIRLI